jgi:invasion protein IalB
MHKHHLLRTVLLSTMFALLAVFLITPVTSAHTATSAQRAATATSQIPAIPNVNIISLHHRSVFSQGTVHCHIQSKRLCITITNLTNKPQALLNLGSTVGTLQPGHTVFIHVTTGPGTYLVTLQSNPDETLHIIAS